MEQNNEANAGTESAAEAELPMQGRRHWKGRRRKNHRTMKWFHDNVVGTELHDDLTVARFYISKDMNETPEIFVIPMMRSYLLNEEGQIKGYKPAYAGDIERNAIPLSTLDVGLFIKSIVDMKARLLRMKAEHHEAMGRVPPPEPEPRAPVEVPQSERHAPRVLNRQVHSPASLPAAPKRRLADLLRP